MCPMSISFLSANKRKAAQAASLLGKKSIRSVSLACKIYNFSQAALAELIFIQLLFKIVHSGSILRPMKPSTEYS